jgi:hypothetical protein
MACSGSKKAGIIDNPPQNRPTENKFTQIDEILFQLLQIIHTKNIKLCCQFKR